MAFNATQHRNQYNSPWGPKEDDCLQRGYHAGLSWAAIARLIGLQGGFITSPWSVQNRARHIGLPRRASSWAPEAKALLLELWNTGKQLCEISGIINAKLGTSFTRNACIGCLHRLNAEHRRKPVTPAILEARRQHRNRYWSEYKKENPGKVNEWQRIHYARHLEIKTAPYFPDLADATIPEAQRKSIYDIKNECRFPVGNDIYGGFFCGGEVVEDRPYCAAHCARAYQPRQPRPFRPARQYANLYGVA